MKKVKKYALGGALNKAARNMANTPAAVAGPAIGMGRAASATPAAVAGPAVGMGRAALAPQIRPSKFNTGAASALDRAIGGNAFSKMASAPQTGPSKFNAGTASALDKAIGGNAFSKMAAAPQTGQPMLKKGGKVSSASKRADGIAQRGKTRGKYI